MDAVHAWLCLQCGDTALDNSKGTLAAKGSESLSLGVGVLNIRRSHSCNLGDMIRTPSGTEATDNQ